MAMTTCKECGKEVSDTAKTCPHCGARQRQKTSILIKIIAVPLVGFLLLFFYFLIAGPSPEDKEKASDRAKIKLCWEDQARKSLDPGTARFVASMCENFEQEFRAKYRHNP
jgi:DNA-directed RNA polymerase subunit RPC12/RpoP